MLDETVGRPVPVQHDIAGTGGPNGARVLATVSEERSTWTRWNLYAETERALRDYRFTDAGGREAATKAVIAQATPTGLAIRITEPALVAEPDGLRRASNEESVFTPHAAERYTTSGILKAEEAILQAARTTGPSMVDPLVAEAAVAVHEGAPGPCWMTGSGSWSRRSRRSLHRGAIQEGFGMR